MQKITNHGKNATFIRKHNELAVLEILRKQGKASRTQLAEKLYLTPQALAFITRNLLHNNLIKEDGRRHNNLVGKPPTIYSLNAEGALSIGINIGRTHLDILLINFCGTVYKRKRYEYPYPEVKKVADIIEKEIDVLYTGLNAGQRKKLMGIGISLPFYLYLWEEELQVPADILSQWKDIDISQRIKIKKEIPLFFENDASSAAIAEIFFGKGQEIDSFLYLYIGSFVGGGVISEGRYLSGYNNNAGALGALLVPPSPLQDKKTPVQLLTRASLNQLRKYLRAQGIHFDNFSQLFSELSPTGKTRQHIMKWADDVGESLAYATLNSTCVMDFQAVIIDGALPEFWIAYITRQAEKEYKELESKGVIKPLFLAGNLGIDARALGSAILPIYHRFSVITTMQEKKQKNS